MSKLVHMNKNRIAYIDNLKVFLTILVVAHHAAQAYGPTGGVWLVQDSDSIPWLRSLFFLNASYMMGLYFFISGYFSSISISGKGGFLFLRDRLIRLGIPLIVFIFLIFGPLHYKLSNGEGNYFVFLLDLYANQPPLATGHLWFVASLLAYSFLLWMGHWLLPKGKMKSAISFLPILILIAGLTLITAFVRQYYPVDAWETWLIPVEPAHLPQYLTLFFLGAYLQGKNSLEKWNDQTGLVFFTLAILLFLLRNSLSAIPIPRWLEEPLMESIFCVGLSIGLLVIFRRLLAKTNTYTRLLSENAYGIYLFHLLIVILFQKTVESIAWPAEGKWIFVFTASLLCSLVLSHLLRKIAVVRKII